MGMKAGDEKVINVTFPEQYHSKDLAGAPVTFDVTVHEVLRLHAPDIDDKLAESMGFKDVENLKGAVRQQIDFEYKNAARAKAKKQLFDALEAGRHTARLLGIREGTLWRRLHDARKLIRQGFERGNV